MMKCCIMQHFIWVFTVCQITRLRGSGAQTLNIRVSKEILQLAVLGLSLIDPFEKTCLHLMKKIQGFENIGNILTKIIKLKCLIYLVINTLLIFFWNISIKYNLMNMSRAMR